MSNLCLQRWSFCLQLSLHQCLVGVIRLLQIDGLHTRISQVVTRYLQKSLEVGENPDDSIEVLTAAFHFVLATSLVLLSLCKLVHRSTRIGIHNVTLRVLVFQVCPRIFKRSVHTQPTKRSRACMVWPRCSSCMSHSGFPSCYSFVMLRDFSFSLPFPFLFFFHFRAFFYSSPRFVLVHLAAGAGTSCVPSTPSRETFRHSVLSGSWWCPAFPVPRRRRSQPRVTAATRHPSPTTGPNREG